MPHFAHCCYGADEYICQVCGQVRCSNCQPSQWRPDITGSKGAGNVCPDCMTKGTKKVEPLLSLREYCALESGLTGQALTDYINRHYGNG